MNSYRFEDLYEDLSVSFEETVTEEMMESFRQISGDENPLHRNQDFAQSQGYKDRVVYGMLTASLISTLGGVYLPGKYCLIQGVEVRFAKPVFIGDVLEVTGEAVKVDRDLRYLEIKVTIRNQRNEKVLRGLLKAGVMDE